MFNEICVNDKCPMCADYCPVPDTEDVCKWEEREEQKRMTFKKALLVLADNYKKAEKSPHVRDKVAWALHQTWKEADADGRKEK